MKRRTSRRLSGNIDPFVRPAILHTLNVKAMELAIGRMEELLDQGEGVDPASRLRSSRGALNRFRREKDEAELLRRQKKIAQRRVQTVLWPLIWQMQTGIEPDKIDIGGVTDLIEMVDPATSPQPALLNTIAFNLMTTLRGAGGKFPEGDDALEREGSLLVETLVTLFIYGSARKLGAPSIFELRGGLADKLMLTDIEQIPPDDVRPPLPGFYIQTPPRSLEIVHFTGAGWHPVSFVGVAERRLNGERSLIAEFHGEPNDASSSVLNVPNVRVEVQLPKGAATIEKVELMGAGPSKPFLRWNGEELPFEDGLHLLVRFVVNFCLYLSSPNPDILPTNGRQPWNEILDEIDSDPITSDVEKPPHNRQIVVGKNFAVWDVGRRVQRLQVLTATDILVRGHWRRQAHGEGRRLRRRIWIEPFVRRPTGGEVEGQEYAVVDRDLKENPLDEFTPPWLLGPRR